MLVHLYLFKMTFLQHIARGIVSVINIVNMQRESRQWFRQAMLSRIFNDGIPPRFK